MNLTIGHHLNSRSSGTSRIQLGGTDVYCYVNGPADTAASTQLPQKSFMTVEIQHFKSDTSLLSETLTNLFSRSIILERYPRCVISMCFQVISDKGCLLSCLINSGFAALMDASISIKLFSPSLTISLRDNEYLINPSKEIELSANSTVTVALDPLSCVDEPKPSLLEVSGVLSDENLFRVLTFSVDSLRGLREKFRSVFSETWCL
ncbi:hypothetical protein RCL1_002102 [Eukaryota sp. TZLM3-RCL]